MEDFIKIYENALSDDMCDYIVRSIDNNLEIATEGTTTKGVNKRVKVSTDLNLLQFDSHFLGAPSHYKDDYIIQEILPAIKEVILKSIFDYNREHPTIAISQGLSDEDFAKKLLEHVAIDPNSILCKKYDQNVGFFNWHIDNGEGWIAHSRILVCMFYLNDVEEGGETEFLHQEISIKPKKGSCNLWVLLKNPIIDEMLNDPSFQDHFMNK